MNEQQKNGRGETDFVTALMMVLSFLLFLITLVTEIKAHFVLSDMAQLLLVMAVVSVVPALGRFLYIWMIAEKVENEDVRNALRAKRTGIALKAALAVILVFGGRLLLRLFGK